MACAASLCKQSCLHRLNPEVVDVCHSRITVTCSDEEHGTEMLEPMLQLALVQLDLHPDVPHPHAAVSLLCATGSALFSTGSVLSEAGCPLVHCLCFGWHTCLGSCSTTWSWHAGMHLQWLLPCMSAVPHVSPGSTLCCCFTEATACVSYPARRRYS